MKQLGGQPAYEAEININGADAHISVFSFSGTLEDVVQTLGRAFDVPAFHSGAGNMGFAVIAGELNVLRLLVVRLPRADTTLVFKVDQSPAEYAASAAPGSHLLAAVPEFPGSNPSFYAEDKHTNMKVALSVASASGNAIRRFYDRRLTADGWKQAMPVNTPGDRGMAVYLKGREICCVVVSSASGGGGENNVALLHKKPGLEQ